jgi:hypothetical protein
VSGDLRVVGASGPGDASAVVAGEAPPAEPGPELDILAALERGDIDVDEAARRLEEVGSRG